MATILQFSEESKISACKPLFNAQLRNKISDGTAYQLYPELIRQCKQCDLDLQTLRVEQEEARKAGTTTTGRGSGRERTGILKDTTPTARTDSVKGPSRH
ncbi:hypothetical protein K402DRAFT_399243 [Aulographum hederae CBS 113979]|uniref:Uncharacterized protein n=1 Tax=Aulographum hederae CBS 113979 TaxID=1176131 RepID=A0A6G1GI68_9PEZI|nr:hypothetical protein K402DRAFT_399243 [Aulographum hederae CBS 113979]